MRFVHIYRQTKRGPGIWPVSRINIWMDISKANRVYYKINRNEE